LGSRKGIWARVARIEADERTTQAGIPITTVPRTLLDLAAVLQPHELNRALESAEALRLSDPTPLVDLLTRHHGRRGTAKLKAALEQGPLRPAITKSELERRFLALVDAADLPRPEVNAWIEVGGDWIQVDCLWRQQRVIAELDSRAYHQTGAAFERDRQRDRRAQAVGWRPVRITDRALRHEPAVLVADVCALLSVPAAPARSA
jgi:very-short-patch-repair endonuclease